MLLNAERELNGNGGLGYRKTHVGGTDPRALEDNAEQIQKRKAEPRTPRASPASLALPTGSLVAFFRKAARRGKERKKHTWGIPFQKQFSE
jgi:hypothetical protein